MIFPQHIVAIPLTPEKAKIIKLFLAALDVNYLEMSEYEKVSKTLTAAIKTLVSN